MTEYHYQKLDVWQKAVDFSLEILAATAQLPESAGKRVDLSARSLQNERI